MVKAPTGRPRSRTLGKRPDSRHQKRGEPTPLHKRSDKQLAFIDEYMVDLNATAAATRAGYSPRSAPFEGSRLLADPVIDAEIQRRMKVRGDAAAISQVDVLRQLERMLFLDIGELVDPATNQLRRIHDIPEEVRRCLVGVELVTFEGAITAIKPVAGAKNKLLELFMRHLGMLRDHAPERPAVEFNLHFGAQPAPAPKPAGGVTIDQQSCAVEFDVPVGPTKKALAG